MSTHTERQFNRVRISKGDMEQCVSYLKAFDAAPDDRIRRALLTAAMVSYARPFSHNKSHDVPTLPINQESRVLGPAKVAPQGTAQAARPSDCPFGYELNPTRPVEFRETGFLVRSRLYDPLSEILDVPAFLELATHLDEHFFSMMYSIAKRGAREGEFQE